MSLTAEGTISRVTSLADGTWRIYLDLQEGFDLSQLDDVKRKLGTFYYTIDETIPEEIKEVLDGNKVEGKSPSQKLRNALFVYFMEIDGRKDGFNDWYIETMDKKTKDVLNKVKELENLKENG